MEHCVSAARVTDSLQPGQAAAAALQTAGVKVHGQFGVQLSARMSPRQARSAAVRSACAYTFRSRPRVRGSARRLLQALQAGQVNSTQAVRAMGLDKVLAANPGLNGTGIRIGIISDSFAAGFPANISSSGCPGVPGTITQKEGPSGSSDEGRAMAELICFVAPQAQLVFRTGVEGEADMAAGIMQLQRQGCRVIVDDIMYPAEAQFSPGILVQAIEKVKSLGVAYFTAGGNEDGTAIDFQSRWATITDPATGEALGSGHVWAPTFSGSMADMFLEIKIKRQDYPRSVDIYLQWNQPFFRNTLGLAGPLSDVHIYVCDKPVTSWQQLDPFLPSRDKICDVYYDTPIGYEPFWPSDLVDHNGEEPPPGAISLGGTQDAAESVSFFVTPSNSPGKFLSKFLFIQHVDTYQGQWDAPANSNLDLKIFWSGDERNNILLPPRQWGGRYLRNGSTTAAHGNTPGAMSICAVDYRNTPAYGVSPAVAEDFSGQGITPIYHDAQGAALPVPVRYLKPDVCAPQNTDTSFFGDDGLPETDTDNTGLPNFKGTSAAAPHAAAVAALMLQQNPLLKPDTIYSLMRATAYDMPYRWDRRTGYGYIAADRLLGPQGFCANQPDGTACTPARSRLQQSTAAAPNPTNRAAVATPPWWWSTNCSTAAWQCRGQACTAVRVPIPGAIGVRCNDNNPCTTNDRCNAQGICAGTGSCGRRRRWP
ncbi:hypothetical protein OEZ86_007124 [Tetradesmus obliquus]|nr:hypothetical protein OEZ86_007124 [Tetradesmus obliquus]